MSFNYSCAVHYLTAETILADDTPDHDSCLSLGGVTSPKKQGLWLGLGLGLALHKLR